jgi:hypothetical protein
MTVDTSSGRSEMDYQEHAQTYSNFMKMTKYITVGIIVLLVLMAMFLV